MGYDQPDVAAEKYYAEMSRELGIAYQHTVDSSAFISRKPHTKKPELIKSAVVIGGFVMRAVEIPREVVGMIIGQGGKRIKELCSQSGAKIQFKVNKTAEKDGRPGLLEVQGSPENVDAGLQMVWDMLQALDKEYVEVPANRLK